MSTKTTIGAGELARAVAAAAPSAKAMNEVLRTVGDTRIGVERTQLEGIRELAVAGVEAIERAAGSMRAGLDDSFERSNGARHGRLLDSIGAIAAIDMPREQVADAIRIAQESERESAARQDGTVGDTSRILAAGASTTFVVLAAAVKWKYARPKTAWEHITNLWS